jgi:hypothetical protein
VPSSFGKSAITVAFDRLPQIRRKIDSQVVAGSLKPQFIKNRNHRQILSFTIRVTISGETTAFFARVFSGLSSPPRWLDRAVPTKLQCRADVPFEIHFFLIQQIDQLPGDVRAR